MPDTPRQVTQRNSEKRGKRLSQWESDSYLYSELHKCNLQMYSLCGRSQFPTPRTECKHPGDTLIIEEDATKPNSDSPTATKRTVSNSVREAVPVLARKVVPADNSCLFTSIYYVVEGGVYEPGCAPEMRNLIAQIVASDLESYSEAVLGKSNQEYCDWIRREDTWGGAIEVSILSKFYLCEICVVDTQTVRIDRFGEDAGYSKRVLLIYDGIHYDPLERKILNSDIPPQTIFSTNDDVVLAQALELADEARRKRQFTDVNRFTLRCMVCQKGLTGQVEAREHAKETGHTNFGEV
ncbi:ubiquitin thioesterase OTU1 isoform X2 [Erythrolamprus reginae]|uniref:ubiquitin thioesterase OTU1 isoform X2 n=1 Tax=Erythrolamprus reginae TaxID=121349 RepID=UPI00396C5573